MSVLKAGSCARVVDQGGGNSPNILRVWPVKTASKSGKVGVKGIVKLLHGPFTDVNGGRWWVVQVLTDPLDPDETGKTGWMAETDPTKPNEVNLVADICP
jgi:hypothetical protein